MRPETTSPMGERWAIASSPPAKVGTKPATVQHGSGAVYCAARRGHAHEQGVRHNGSGGWDHGWRLPDSSYAAFWSSSSNAPFSSPCSSGSKMMVHGCGTPWRPLACTSRCGKGIRVQCGSAPPQGGRRRARSCSPSLAGWLVAPAVAAARRHALCVKATTTAVTSSALAASSACHRCHASSTSCGQGAHKCWEPQHLQQTKG